MRAAIYDRLGAARDVLRICELPIPEPGPGEVRVRVAASGVNPSDWKARAGGRGAMAWPHIVPHSDGAGVIDALGPGVTRQIGERVWIWNGQYARDSGTAADYIVLPERQAPPLPDQATFLVGASIGIPLFTAWQAIRLGEICNGMRVLVAGGAGSVASYAIQLAKLAGADVIATVSSTAKGARAAEAGADRVVDYTREALPAAVRTFTGGRGIDVAIDVDFATNAALYPEIIAPHGRAVIYGTRSPNAAVPILPLIRASIQLRPFLIYTISAADRAAGIRKINTLLAAGRLRHFLGATFPLDHIVAAHEAGEAKGVIGNIVLELG